MERLEEPKQITFILHGKKVEVKAVKAIQS